MANFRERSSAPLSKPSKNRNVFCAADSPSKAALSATKLAFAIELEKTNIKVNVVCPGFVATDLNNYGGYRTVEQGARQGVKMALNWIQQEY